MLDKTKLIVRPIVTEKSELLKNKNNQYAFEVLRGCNKIEIKNAIEKLFNVKVKKVRVLNYHGKPKRMGVFIGRRSRWRKAYVTLEKDNKIEMFER
ncbi:MAG: 50S ribosomal protein L23 [candidate division WOR-3 bacterium]